jgi:hypothetical protein
MRPHSSYIETLYPANAGSGVAIQCQFCPGQSFRRSRVRWEDLNQIFLMRYPVRCLRCGQRQTVSFTVAGISVPSHVKQRRARQIVAGDANWTGPVKESLRPNSTRMPGVIKTNQDAGPEGGEKTPE